MRSTNKLPYMTSIKLEPYFLHQEQVISLLGPVRTDEAFARASRMVRLPATQQFALAGALAAILSNSGIVELQRDLYKASLNEGQVVGIQQAFYFRRARERNRPGDKPIDFHAKLNTDGGVEVKGTLNA